MTYILLGLTAAFTAVAAGFAIDCSMELKKQRRQTATMLALLRTEVAGMKAELLHHVEHLAVHGKQRNREEARAFVEQRRAARGH